MVYLFWLIAACTGETDEPSPSHPFEAGPEVTCEGDGTKKGLDRFTEEGAARGLDLVYEPDDHANPCHLMPGGPTARDLDGDGDVDLMLWQETGFPALYDNDGTGNFTRVEVSASLSTDLATSILGQAAVDLDGDRLPEIVLTAEGLAVAYTNEGDWSWTGPEILFQQTDWPKTCFHGLNFGDADGDGDLDLVLPGLEAVPSEGELPSSLLPKEGTADPLVLQTDDGWTLFEELAPYGEGGLAFVAFFTDRDQDGDQDLYLGSDRPYHVPPAAFLRNDGNDGEGLPQYENDAEEIGVADPISAMGVDIVDLNGDGELDYCLSNLANRLYCPIADGAGGYYDGALALGLEPDIAGHGIDPSGTGGFDPETGTLEGYAWSPWGLEVVDLDNDGLLDAVASAGRPPDFGTVEKGVISDNQVDAMFQGQSDGTFVDRGPDVPFGDNPTGHYGLAAADFDGDGYRDLIQSVWDGPPLLWMNQCRPNGTWIEIALVGTGPNAEAQGAIVTVDFGGESRSRQVQNVRGFGQGPTQLHFGLGREGSVSTLRVLWPDGQETESLEVPVNRVVTVAHPDRAAE